MGREQRKTQRDGFCMVVPESRQKCLPLAPCGLGCTNIKNMRQFRVPGEDQARSQIRSWNGPEHMWRSSNKAKKGQFHHPSFEKFWTQRSRTRNWSIIILQDRKVCYAHDSRTVSRATWCHVQEAKCPNARALVSRTSNQKLRFVHCEFSSLREFWTFRPATFPSPIRVYGHGDHNGWSKGWRERVCLYCQ